MRILLYRADGQTEPWVRDFAEVLPRYPVLREHPELRNWFEILDVDDAWIFDPANAPHVSP